MNNFKLGLRSLRQLEGCHPDLIRLAVRALQLSPTDFAVTEGKRDKERQRILVASGASRTMNSMHLPQADGFSWAYDFMAVGDLDKNGINDAKDLKRTWDRVLYTQIAQVHKLAAIELGIEIECGALDWPTFFDGPHIQLKR